MEKKVRMADIAELLGVSVVTVSKALAGKEGVGSEMREKILTLAREMGYSPLRTKPVEKPNPHSGNIGILVADLYFAENTFYSGLYRQVLMCCKKCGYSALLDLVTKDAERTCALPSMIVDGKVDGVIFMGEISRAYRHAVTKTGLPFLLLDFFDEESEGASVTSDNLSGGYLLTRHLIDTGRRDIGFVGSISATSSIMERFLGYTKGLLSAGIAPRMDWVQDDRDADGQYLPLELPDPMPQAFLCSCDQVAYLLVNKLKKAGYRVPQDVAVVGYDDHYYAQICSPQLTTYRVNIEDMSKTVVRELIARIHGEQTTVRKSIVQGKLIRRASTERM